MDKLSAVKKISGRIITSFLMIMLVVTLVFVIIRIAPGNPGNKFISPELSPEMIKEIQHRYAFSKNNIAEQYFSYLQNFFSGDFGFSISYREPVINVIGRFLPVTLMISGLAFILQSLFSLLLVRFVYFRPAYQSGLKNFFFLFFTIPPYVTGLALIIIFSVFLGIFPVSGLPTMQNAGTGSFLLHLVLPVLTISLPGTAIFFNYMTDAVEENRNANYVLFLRSAGMNENQIFYKHILPNAVLPLLSIAAIEIGFLLSGSLIVEVLFSIPGFGRMTYGAFVDRDYPLISAAVILSAAFMILSNLGAEIVKSLMDKRMKELI